ncbi:MAG: type II secretion system protein GspD [Planctomycetota bacterium]
MKPSGRHARRSRWPAAGAAALLAASLAACSSSSPQADQPERVVLADVDDADGGEDLTGFPVAPGLLPRDYVMKETTGDLKGYLTKFYRVRSQSGPDLAALLGQWKSPKARILAVPQHNMLVITETEENLPRLMEVLNQVDVPQTQVEIEAKVIEILESNGYEFGFELHVDRAPAGNTALRRYDGTFHSNSFLESLVNTGQPYQGASLDWASVGKVVEELGDFNYIMRALETEGYAEIVSQPRIVCRSGQKATLRTETRLPIQDIILLSTNNPRITTSYTNVGVTLEVTPQVIGRDAITVLVHPIVSNVVRFELNTGGFPTPVIASRSAETRVDIRNGELLVIGGLLDKQRRTDQRRVPIVGDIPILGRLFQSEDDFEQKTQIVFLLRLRILTTAEKARARGRIPITREEKVRREETEEEAPPKPEGGGGK